MDTIRTEMQAVRNELKGEIKAVETRPECFEKRIDTQEFIKRDILITVLGGILAALANSSSHQQHSKR